jgi:hypothetical protein
MSEDGTPYHYLLQSLESTDMESISYVGRSMGIATVNMGISTSRDFCGSWAERNGICCVRIGVAATPLDLSVVSSPSLIVFLL